MTNEGYMPRQGFLIVTIESESEWLDTVDIVMTSKKYSIDTK